MQSTGLAHDVCLCVFLSMSDGFFIRFHLNLLVLTL